MERYERIFFLFSAVMLAVFLVALAYVSVFMHIGLPGPSGRIIPKPGEALATAALTTPPFNHAGLHQIAPGRYEADILAMQWTYLPNKIEVPVGSTVTFKLTSADVIHGFLIPHTRVNMMVIPSYITVETYRFRRRGTYRFICDEYCGLQHQTMTGEVVVK